MVDKKFYKGKKILITGHTGFKGSWMCMLLQLLGADIVGYSLEASEEPSLYRMMKLSQQVKTITGDVRNPELLNKTFAEEKPDIVFHMAAQPIVRESYLHPAETYQINVMGTVNVLESVRLTDSVRSLVNVTTDKVYRNKEWEWGYREDEELNGFDPYSNSKSCSELVTGCYRHSFFSDRNMGISTARAGNVIGGGDFATDRIIPDCVRAGQSGGNIIVRNPDSIRPYQYVLEPLNAYLLIARRQFEEVALAGSYNVGPNERECITTKEIVELFCGEWNKIRNPKISWECRPDGGPHEASLLKLDCSRIKSRLNWSPRWTMSEAVRKTVEWTDCYLEGGDVVSCMEKQIEEYWKKESEYV